MLGWMLKRGFEGGRDATNLTDDSHFEQPDTPAPVFAARAFKSAIFGTPARPDNYHIDDLDEPLAHERNPDVAAATMADDQFKDISDAKATPGRLPGILLTPGTATSRRKRVSFGHDVEHDEIGRNNNNNVDNKKSFKIDREGHGRPNLFSDARSSTATSRHSRHKTRSKLAEALENARRQSSGPGTTDNAADAALTSDKPDKQIAADTQADQNLQRKQAQTAALASEHDGAAVVPAPEEGEAQWEDVNEEKGSEWDADVTVDLNEPYSQSGRYWKAQFQRYQEDAKAEMSKLLKYKQLAKSYAKMKDAEAGDLRAKLQEEKEKVVHMESRITDIVSQMARKRMRGSDRDYQGLIGDLTRQTALAVQYRNQVKELEAMIQEGQRRQTGGSDSDDDDEVRRRPQHVQTAASPRTQRTLLETQRELRRARDQVKELAQAKEELRRLKGALRAAEARALKSESQNKALAADVSSAEAAAEAAASTAADLERRAQFAEDERRRKVEELQLLQKRYDSLKEDAKARVSEAEQVLRRKNEQIAELKKKATKSSTNISTSTSTNGLAARHQPAAWSDRQDRKHDYQEQREQFRRSIEALDSFALELDDLQLGSVAKSKSGQKQQPREQEQQKHKQHQQPIAILEDETSHFEMPAAAGPTAQNQSTSAPAKKTDDAASLRRRRGVGALRTIDAQHLQQQHREQQHPQQPLPQKTTAALSTRQPVSASSDGLQIDLVGSHFARLGDKPPVPSAAAAAYVKPSATAHKDALSADHHALAADVSRCSLPSERAAAAVARIEKRRAERKRALGMLRDKENMRPMEAA